MAKSKAALIKVSNLTLLTEGKLDAVDQYFSTDYLVHLTDGDMRGGHSMVKRVLSSWLRSFPNPVVEVDILLEKGARVAWQRTIRATHKAAYHGFPATNRKLVWRDLVVSEFRDGLFAEDWLQSDLAERLLLARKKASK